MFIDNPILKKIWEDRYRKNDETLEENFQRVSNYIGQNKEDKEEYFNIMNNGRFFPAGRTMSNSGVGKSLTLNNCFMENTKVLTKRGLVNIQDILVGDFVITEDNSWQRVNNVMSREYVGDIYKIKAPFLYDDIYCTPNHKFLTQNGWKRADRIEALPMRIVTSDRLKIPNTRVEKKYEDIDLMNYVINSTPKGAKIAFEEIDGVIHPYTESLGGNNTKCKKASNSFNRCITMDEDMMYFIGRWLGDGSVTMRGQESSPKSTNSVLQIVFNAKNDKFDSEKIIEIGTRKFGIVPNVRVTEQNVISVRWNCETICNFFYQEFGKGCSGKIVKDKYLGDFNIALGLLDSDGYMCSHCGIKIVLKNYNLLKWLRDTLFMNGIPCSVIKPTKHIDTYGFSIGTSISKRKLAPFMMKQCYDKRNNIMSVSDLLSEYIQISEISILENISTKVYNISVENIHSYTVNGVVAHNCFIAPQIKDDLSDIFSKVALGAKTHQKGGGIGYDFSNLRPKGSPTSNDAIASGAISFMDVFNSQTSTILQGSRRK